MNCATKNIATWHNMNAFQEFFLFFHNNLIRFHTYIVRDWVDENVVPLIWHDSLLWIIEWNEETTRNNEIFRILFANDLKRNWKGKKWIERTKRRLRREKNQQYIFFWNALSRQIFYNFFLWFCVHFHFDCFSYGNQKFPKVKLYGRRICAAANEWLIFTFIAPS